MKYLDLSLSWLVTGNGQMLKDNSYEEGGGHQLLQEDKPAYVTDENTVKLMREKIMILENSLADKEKIICLIEGRLSLRHA